jgi:protein gp37
MGFNSSIEWTTHTFNPWWGCTKVSEGCKNCYAEALAKRYGHSVWGKNQPRRLLSDAHWLEPIRWNTMAKKQGARYQVFCASMADVFEEQAPRDQFHRLWQVIKDTPYLDWQLLTKRPHRIAENLPGDWGEGYSNVWLGTSVEDVRVIGRINQLISVPAIVHFLSLEPLLGPLPSLPLNDIEWVIAGGESGHGARPVATPWVLDIRDQCREAGVAFFFKQWGGVNKKARGRQLQGRYYNQMPTPVT